MEAFDWLKQIGTVPSCFNACHNPDTITPTDHVVDVRRRVVDPVPKRAIYSIMCILFFDRNSVQYVSKHRHFTMVWYVNGISAKKIASILLYLSFWR